MDSLKLYIDDIRKAPDGWINAKTVTDAIRIVESYGRSITDISIDHDISYAVDVAGTQRPFPSPENFTAVARFIGMFYQSNTELKNPSVMIHSANPVGCQELKYIFDSYGIVSSINMSAPANRLELEVK